MNLFSCCCKPVQTCYSTKVTLFECFFLDLLNMTDLDIGKILHF